MIQPKEFRNGFLLGFSLGGVAAILALLMLMMISCKKPECAAPSITGLSGNVVYFQPAGSYTLEVVGIDGPYKGFLQVSGDSQRVEGARYKVRIKSQCSGWSEWVYKQ